MPKKSILFCILMALSLLAFCEDKDGVIEGKGWAFLAAAPNGWVRDGKSLRSQGIEALYCKLGAQFSPATIHLYISPTNKSENAPSSLDEFIREDKASFMASKQGIVVKDLLPYDPGMGYVFPRCDLDDSVDGYYQALAYYEGSGAYFVFVLACRSSAEREAERGALLELLSSFTYLEKE
jgi:hypothetical protein